MARRGKIARLPHDIRTELNQRIRDGEVGSAILTWLNALPDVKAVLATHFDARPVTDQNLSDWRAGGYQDWLDRADEYEQARKTTEHAQYICSALGLDPSDALSLIVTGKLVRLLEGEQTPDDIAKLGHVLTALTRRDEAALAREKFRSAQADRAEDVTRDESLSDAEKQSRIREIFGLS